jgi:hypothetical protein
MEIEYLLPCSQQPTTGLYSESVESSLHSSISVLLSTLIYA